MVNMSTTLNLRIRKQCMKRMTVCVELEEGQGEKVGWPLENTGDEIVRIQPWRTHLRKYIRKS